MKNIVCMFVNEPHNDKISYQCTGQLSGLTYGTIEMIEGVPWRTVYNRSNGETQYHTVPQNWDYELVGGPFNGWTA